MLQGDRFRGVRLAVATLLTVLVSTGAHRAAGGRLSVIGAMVLLIVTLPVLTLLTRRRLPVAVTGPTLGGVQLLWHAGLMVAGAPRPAGTVVMDPSSHHVVMSAATMPSHEMSHSVGWGMLAAHALAGLAIGAWLHKGETVLQAMADALARFTLRLLIRVRALFVPDRTPPIPADDDPTPDSHVVRLPRRRGPPSSPAVLPA